MAKLLLAGCGKMGSAMLAGWLENPYQKSDIVVIEPNGEIAQNIASRFGVATVARPDDLNPNETAPDVIVFAVKPQVMDDVVPAYGQFAASGCVYLSIAAGKTIGYFQSILGQTAAIVRAMPNTPAAVGRGITVACANGPATEAQIALCDTLLGAVGEVAWSDDEGQLDAVTALSGGGPAYVFLLAECLAQAGMDAGLPADLAHRLARATVAGSGELLFQSSDQPATLRHNVTSPGGTTAEALKILMADDGWQPLITKAIAAATKRSKELAGD